MFFFLANFAFTSSYPDSDRKPGLTYLRYTPQITKAELPSVASASYSEHFNSYFYVHPEGNRPKSTNNTIILTGTYYSNETQNVEFKLISQPPGAAVLFDGNIIIGKKELPAGPCETTKEKEEYSSNLTVHAHRYHQLAIFHNPGCYEYFRKVELTAKFGNSERFLEIPTTNIYEFHNSECAEGFYGPVCSGDCAFSNCSNNGRCNDGQSGTGKCDCISGYIGPTCSDICRAEVNCNSHGRCLGNGECQCHTGWTGSDCSKAVDSNLRSRMIIGIVFYSAGAFCFLVSFIFHLCKVENSNPLTHVFLFIFCCMKLAHAVIAKIKGSYTLTTEILLLVPVAILAFCILRSIILIKDQFKATSPHFKFILLSISLYVVPVLILLFAALGPTVLKKFLLYAIGIPFGVLALYCFFFCIAAMFFGMSEPFAKMDDLFPHIARELRSSRRYVMCASLFFCVDVALAWLNVDIPKQNFIILDFAYYGLIYVDIFTITCIGLANSVALSDIFAVKGDDVAFIPVGIASVTDLEDQDASMASMENDYTQPLYNFAPNVYKEAENRFKKQGCWPRCLKFTAMIIILPIVAITAFLLVVHPSSPEWTLNNVNYDDSNLFNDTISFLPNITVHNKMRVTMNLTEVKVTLKSRNLTIGSGTEFTHNVSPNGMTHLFFPVAVKKAGAFLANIKAGDGKLELTTVCEANPSALGFLRYRSKVQCQETLQIFPTYKVLDNTKRCVVEESKLSFKF